MVLRQFLHADPVAASYLFGCGGKASGAVVDPVGDLGRTERASIAEDGARVPFRSVHVLKALLDCLEVLPGAYSGSVCGRKLRGKPTSTIGFEARHNSAFRIIDVAELVAAMTADIPPPPPEAAQNRATNLGQVGPT